MGENLVYVAASGNLAHSAAGNLVYKAPPGPSTALPYPGRYYTKDGITTTTWAAAYAAFVAAAYTGPHTSNFRCGQTTNYKNVPAPWKEVFVTVSPFDTSALAGYSFTKVSLDILTYTNVTGANMRLGAVVASGQPPTATVAQIQASPQGAITAAGVQTITLNKAFICSTVLYLYVFENPYPEPGSGQKDFCDMRPNTGVTLLN